MLLTEGILRATGAAQMEPAEYAVSNLPGLLADKRAIAWAATHACYLARLRELGQAACAADPANCKQVPPAPALAARNLGPPPQTKTRIAIVYHRDNDNSIE